MPRKTHVRPRRRVGLSGARVLAESLEPRRLLANDFAVGTNPSGVVAADFNGDGRRDLATANGGGTVSILIGRADGTFIAATSVSAGASAMSLVAGDFNVDGKVDLAVANYVGSVGSVSVLAGLGNGTFAAAVTFSTARPYPSSIVTGDFNNDGDLDLATSNYNVFGTVSVLLGGTGLTFAAATLLTTGDAPRKVTTGDFNNDGKLDLATANANTTGTVSVLRGVGNGTFLAATAVPTPANPQVVVAGDFTGDGLTDLATASLNGTSGIVQVQRNNGDGTFTPVSTPLIAASPTAIIAADFDNDGALDLATANNAATNTVSVLMRNSVGSYTVSTLTFGPGPLAIVAADVNADGRADLATANTTNATVSVRLGLGDGRFVDGLFGATSVLTGPTTPGSSVIADLDNDGVLDMAVTSFNNPGLVRTYKGLGDGTFNVVATYVVGASPAGPVAADFNGDGLLDLATAAGSISGTVSILFGVGGCMFASGPTLLDLPLPSAIVTGDFNGDGRADLAANSYNTNTVRSWLGNGDGTFGPQIVTTLGGGLLPINLAAADFNNDGRTDLATANNSETGGTVTALRANADGTFAVTANVVLGGKGYVVAFGDFNGDGLKDLAVGTDAGGGRYHVLPGNGAGGFAFAAATLTTGITPQALIAGDFNNDGKTDLTAAYGSYAAVLLGNGAGAVAPFPRVITPTNAAFAVSAGDLNGDGRLDLVTAGTGSTNLTMALNQVPQASPAAVGGGVFTATTPGQTVRVTDGVIKQTLSSGAVAYYNASAVREYRADYDLTIQSDLGRSGGLANVALTLNSFSGVTLTASQHLSALTLNTGSRLSMAAGRKLLRFKTLSTLTTQFTIDLNDSDLIYDYTSGTPQQSVVRAAIAGGRAGGTWTGFGLTSTAAKNNPGGRTTLGYMEASDYKAIYGTNALFAGEKLDATAVLVTYTLYGDADLNKTVNFNDFLRLQTAFGQTNQGYAGGDFDYDNDTDFNDFLALQTNFGVALA